MVILQQYVYASDMTPDDYNPLRQYILIIRREGHYAVALQRYLENAKSYAARPRSLYLTDGKETAPLAYLHLLIRDALSRGIRIWLFVYPYHADLLETIRAVGLWPCFEECKREVIDMVAQEAMSAPAGSIVLWDFADYDKYTMESIPELGDCSERVSWSV
jgi:hypothetical protein